MNYPTIITSSLDIVPCDYKWAIDRVLELRQPKKFHRDLDFGGVIAEAVYTARKSFYIDRNSAKVSVDSALDVIDTKFVEAFEAYNIEQRSQGKDPEKYKIPDRAIGLLQLYFRKFPLDLDNLVPFTINNQLSAETSLKMPILLKGEITEKVVWLAIKPDLIATTSSGTVLCDEKTVTESDGLGKKGVFYYLSNPQFLYYSYVLQTLIAEGKLNLSNLQAFEVRKLVMTYGASAKNDEIERISIAINWKTISEFAANFVDKLTKRYVAYEEYITASEQSMETLATSFKKDFSACWLYNRPCALIEHCTAGRKVELLGFKPSTINPVTKEVTFL
jgi:hypothetical protein